MLSRVVVWLAPKDIIGHPMLKCSQRLKETPIGAVKLWSFKSVNLVYLSSIRNRHSLWQLSGETCLSKFPDCTKVFSIYLKILKPWPKL